MYMNEQTAVTCVSIHSSYYLHTDHCWVHYADMNAVGGQIPYPQSENRPTTFYFSEVDNRQACLSTCDEVAECFAYTWIDPDLASGYAGQCYGVNEQSASHYELVDHYSGKKTDCVICWDRHDHVNTVFERITLGAGSTNPPEYYLFADVTSRDECQLACEREPSCYAYTYHGDVPEMGDWAGLCYGISEAMHTNEHHANHYSGFKTHC